MIRDGSWWSAAALPWPFYRQTEQPAETCALCVALREKHPHNDLLNEVRLGDRISMDASSNQQRRRIQFSIATLLFFTVICCLSLAWWLDHANLRKQLNREMRSRRDAELNASVTESKMIRERSHFEAVLNQLSSRPTAPAR